MLEIQKDGASYEFGRLPEEGTYEFEQRQGQFLCALDAGVLARFQAVSAELESVEQKMRDVHFDELYHAHLRLRVEKSRLHENLLHHQSTF